jgi:hypothetical protein
MSEPAIKVLPELSKFAPDNSTAVIVLESDDKDFPRAIESLQTMATQQIAIAYACQNGISDARLNSPGVATFAVNKNGVPCYDVVDAKGNPVPLTHPDAAVNRYRGLVKVIRSLI